MPKGGEIEPIYPLLGKALRAMRRGKGWSQERLGEYILQTRSSIANIETGKQRLGLADLLILLGALTEET